MGLAPTIPPFSPQQLAKLKDVAKAQKIAKKADTASAIIGVVGDIATSIISTTWAIRNEQQRARLEEQIQYLDELQATELENSLRAIQSQNDRLAFIVTFMSKVEAEKSAKKIKSSIESQNLGGVMGERKKIILIFGGVIVLLIGLFIVKKVTK